VYFFGFLMLFPLIDKLTKDNPSLEPLGIGLFMHDMQAALLKIHPDYSGGFSLGSGGETIIGTFKWMGIQWTPDLLLGRFLFVMIAILLTLVSAFFFDRFDPSRSKPLRMKSIVPLPKPETAPISQMLSQPLHLTPLGTPANRFAFTHILISEIKLLLKGQRWWWYAVAAGLFIAALVNTPENVRAFVFPFAWIWPILIWSGLGNREIQHNTHQMVFSSAAPLMRQLPAQWLAGFLVTALSGSGVALKLISVEDKVGLLAWLSAALFIPSFALALGVWSNSHKLFEVLYVTLWYLGPMNKVASVDFLGANSNGNIGFFIPFSIALIVAAFLGRARQLQN
jgi:hypothetical protein